MEKKYTFNFLTDEGLEVAEKAFGQADISLLSFGAVGQVDYEKEIRGEETLLTRLATLSKNTRGVVICGAYTNALGVLRRSAIVAEGGKMLGVSDMTCLLDGEDGNCGFGVKVYSARVGNIGVLVGKDALFYEQAAQLVGCGAELIVGVYGEEPTGIEQVLIRAHAYSLGVPVALIARGFVAVAGESGEIEFASPMPYGAFEVCSKSDYRLLETRIRGFAVRGRK